MEERVVQSDCKILKLNIDYLLVDKLEKKVKKI